MNTQSKWKKIKSWNVGTPDGSSEVYSLYEDEETGNFKIQNDFGNISIEMERMSGYEFLKRASQELEDSIRPFGIDDTWFDSLDDADCDDANQQHMD